MNHANSANTAEFSLYTRDYRKEKNKTGKVPSLRIFQVWKEDKTHMKGMKHYFKKFCIQRKERIQAILQKVMIIKGSVGFFVGVFLFCFSKEVFLRIKM